MLEAEGLPVGVVTAINGANRFAVEIEGMAGHAGTVPMSLRRDALAAAAECVLAIESRCAREPDLVGTVGRIEAAPGATNVIPGHARFTIDLRAPPDEQRAAGGGRHRGGHRVDLRPPQREGRHPPDARRQDRRLRALAAGSDRARDRGRRAAGAPAALGRGPRRHGDRRPRRHRHAVRALRGRHQPQPAGSDHASRTPSCPRGSSCASSSISNPPPEGHAMPASTARAIEDYLAAQREHQTRFLAELVKVPSDNPPGDCAPHARARGRAARRPRLRRSSGIRCPPTSSARTA